MKYIRFFHLFFLSAALLINLELRSQDTEPTEQPTEFQVVSLDRNFANITWQLAPSSDHTLVIVNEGSSTEFVPQNGTTYLDAGLYGNGFDTGSGFVVYSGTDNSISITGLTPGTPYFVTLYSFKLNVNDPGYFLADPPLQGSFFTPDTPFVTSSLLNADNSYIDVSINVPVWGDISNTIPVQLDGLNVNFARNGGSGILNGVTSLTKIDQTPLTGGETQIRINLDVLGPFDGTETIQVTFPGGSLINSNGQTGTTQTNVLNFNSSSGAIFIDPLGGDIYSSSNLNSTVVFEFTINNESGTGPLEFETLTFRIDPSSGIQSFNSFLSQDPELRDDQNNSSINYSVAGDVIVFATDFNSLGRVQSNGSKRFFLSFTMGGSIWPAGADGSTFIPQIIGADQATPINGTFNNTSTVSSNQGGNANILQVTGTNFVVETPLPSLLEQNTTMATGPVVRIRDDYGNLDLDYNSTNFSLISTNASVTPNWTATFNQGRVDFSNDLTFSGLGATEIFIRDLLGPFESTLGAITIEDNTAPLPLDIQISNPVVNETDLTQEVVVTYSEEMDPNTAPTVVFESSPNFTEVNRVWTDGVDGANSVFTASFIHNGLSEQKTNENIVISGASDPAGNIAFAGTSSGFEINVISCADPSATISANPVTCLGNGEVIVSNIIGSASSYLVELLPSGGSTPIAANSAATNFTFTDVPAGLYDVRITGEGETCSIVLQITVAETIETPIYATTVEDDTSCGGGNGAITINVTYDVGLGPNDYTIDISQGTSPGGAFVGSTSSGIPLGGLEGIDYFITVTNIVSGCEATSVVTVADNPSNVTVTGTATNNISCLSPNGSISLVIDGGVSDLSPYQISWYLGSISAANLLPAYSGSSVATGLIGGTYVVEVINTTTGCSNNTAANVYTISDISNPPSITANVQGTTNCTPNFNGEIVIQTTGGSGSFSYQWDAGAVDAGFSGGVLSADGTSATQLEPNTYYIVAEDLISGCFSDPLMVVVEDLTTIPSIVTDQVINNTSCIAANGAISVSISGGSNDYSISWTSAGGFSSTVEDITNLSEDDYTITVTDNASGCIAQSGPITVLPNQTNPSFTLNTTPLTSCTSLNGEIQAVGSVSPDNYTFQWYAGSSPVNGTILDEATSNTLSGRGVGDYTVVIRDNDSGCEQIVTAQIIDQRIDINATFGSPATVCGGQGVILSVGITNGTGPYTLDISGGIGTITNYTAGAGIPVNPSVTTTYTVQSITDLNGCTASVLPAPVTVTVIGNPQVFNVGGGGEACTGGASAEVTLSGSEQGVNYSLLRDGTELQSTLGTGSALSFTGITEAGTYTVEADVNSNCLTVMSGNASIVVGSAPSLSGGISGTNNPCEGSSGLSYTVTDPGGVQSFEWTLPAGWSINSGAGTNSITASVAAGASSGTISVVALNSCGSSLPQSLPATVGTGFSFTIDTETTIYAGRSSTFSINSSENISTVIWDFGDGGSSAGGSTSYSYAEGGTYTITATVTGSSGCTITQQQSITVGELAAVTIRNAVTPNGDGANDVLYIDNIEIYPGSEVVFMDRWGKTLKTFRDYQNDWDMSLNGDIIPAGNYICIVRIEGGESVSMTVTVVK